MTLLTLGWDALKGIAFVLLMIGAIILMAAAAQSYTCLTWIAAGFGFFSVCLLVGFVVVLEFQKNWKKYYVDKQEPPAQESQKKKNYPFEDDYPDDHAGEELK